VTLAVAVAAAAGANCLAQEVGSIDLTRGTARTELRRPPSVQGTDGARGSNTQFHTCFDSSNNAGALRTTLVSLDRAEYQIGDKLTFEVTVENIGSAPMSIPIFPHLADLKPEDPAEKFGYSKLELVLWIAAGAEWSANTGGAASLYGADDHADTMLKLNPGESVRIIGKSNVGLNIAGAPFPDQLAVDHAYAQVSLSRVETLLTPLAVATVSRQVCLKQTKGTSVPIALTSAEK